MLLSRMDGCMEAQAMSYSSNEVLMNSKQISSTMDWSTERGNRPLPLAVGLGSALLSISHSHCFEGDR